MDLSNIVLLDTETTGVYKNSQVCEISMVDGKTGLVLLDTLVKPSVPISKVALETHGISEEMVKDAPTWGDIHHIVQRILTDTTAVAYNHTFDKRMMKQSAEAYGLRLKGVQWDCAMKWLHDYMKTRTDPNPKWPKLTDVAEQYGIEFQGDAHRALADAVMTREVILAVRREDQLAGECIA
ncbi:MAG: 3'-5' exonuclease [Aestuariibacter sp.]|nr:3'-5' exonuclease [Aestuariibacter sp.]|tara:strand:+ start:269966 stop:270508 length:543 start_codon:yes stop_codon:yes gene_type:complete